VCGRAERGATVDLEGEREDDARASFEPREDARRAARVVRLRCATFKRARAR